jgi:hypothetical protein
MRTLGYLFAGWILFGIAMNGLVMLSSGDLSGVFIAVVFGAGLVWLVRSFRRGSRGMGALEPAVQSLVDRFDGLGERLPEDPLENRAILLAWSVHLHEPNASEELRKRYEEVRSALVEARAELEADPQAALDDRRTRIDSVLAETRDYLGAVETMAEHEPALLDEAIAEHARAAAAVERARAEGVSVEQLTEADAKLRGARNALRKAEERPLDALRLADEAQRLVAEALRAR